MDKVNQWTSELAKLRAIIQKTELIVTNKWGGEVYVYDNKNVLGLGGFKNFFTIWFFNGVFLKDKHKVLVNAQDGKTKALRQWRFTSVEQIDENRILAYIKEAIDVAKEGKTIVPAKFTPVAIPGILQTALKKNKALKKAYDGLTPGKQKEYNLYIIEAKQEATKARRMEKIIPMIIKGIGLNDRYKQ